MNISVIIPSKNPQNLAVSVGAVKALDPTVRIIIVDDGLGELKTDCTVVKGISPFIFSRNVNLGIHEALSKPECGGVVILNDDAVLKTEQGLSVLAEAAKACPDFGLIAATTNNVGNLNQRPKGVGLRVEPRMACFICVYIPRTTIERLRDFERNGPDAAADGMLSPRYECYSHQDDDYCLRVRLAGLKIGIHDGCFVDHASLVSTFRGPGGTAELTSGARIFEARWGAGNHAL